MTRKGPGIERKSEEELALMRQAGRIVGEVLAMMREKAQPGVSTGHLDAVAEEIIRDYGAVPAFKGYPHSGHNDSRLAYVRLSTKRSCMAYPVRTGYSVKETSSV